MFIQMTPEQGAKYRSALAKYESLTGKPAKAPERVEAFRYATSPDPWQCPWWGR